MSIGLTKEEGINRVYEGAAHVVILGAGASIASTEKDPELNGKKLPSMNNIIDILGLRKLVNSLPKEFQVVNFEEMYSKLFEKDPESYEICELERIVYEYFSQLKLPEKPTIYDFLVLSLRPKDLIATFNWDPFLLQAWNRNYGKADLPRICFLHGSVNVGYSIEEQRFGPAGYTLKSSNSYLEPTELLFPIRKKNYYKNEFAKLEWDTIKEQLKKESGTKLVTIFGYGAPSADVEAMNLLSNAWGEPYKRNMEQFEIIDIRSENEVIKSWRKFIHSHHYNYCTNYFNSSLSCNPRRTGERFFHAYLPLNIDEAFQEPNPIPSDFETMEEMWNWFQPLIQAENLAKSKE